MITRFILGAIFLTAFFVLAIPVLQVAALFSGGAQPAPAEIAAIETAAGESADQVIVDFEDLEALAPSDDDLAAILNEIEPAASAEETSEADNFGSYFRSEQPEGFSDHLPEASPDNELDL